MRGGRRQATRRGEVVVGGGGDDVRGWREGLSSSSNSSSNSNSGETNDEDDDSNKMAKRTEQGDKYPDVADGRGTRSGILMTAATRVGDEEGMMRRIIGRKSVELNQNWNWTPDQDQDRDRAPDRIQTYRPPILLSNHHHHCRRIVRRCVGREGSPTRASGGWGYDTQRNGGWNGDVRRNYQRRYRIGRDWWSSATAASAMAMATNIQSWGSPR